MHILCKELSRCVRYRYPDANVWMVSFNNTKRLRRNLYIARKKFITAALSLTTPRRYVNILGFGYSDCVKGIEPSLGDYLKQYPIHNRIICMATGADIAGDVVYIGGERIYVKCK